MNLHYAGYQPQASGFGWATCNASLVRELGKQVNLVGPGTAEVVFMPLADHDFNPVSDARGKINVAYTFFEFPLGPKAAENAAKYDIVFVGSSWCLERLRERNITNGEVLIQGVDHRMFRPTSDLRLPTSRKSFRIFSGGKFEYRKGQDLVIAAFKEFAKTHPEAHLVCSWFNPWPHLIYSMTRSPHIDMTGEHVSQSLGWDVNSEPTLFHRILIDNGLRPEQFTILPQLSQQKLAQAMQNTDCGLFPNRCEGGTNLVLMEYAACGRPVVANTLTGHSDVRDAIAVEIPATEDTNHWAMQSVSDIVSALKRPLSSDPSDFRPPISDLWSWERAARQIVDSVEALTPA